jgi:hypothetical protein
MSQTSISLSFLSSVYEFFVLKILVPNGIILIHDDRAAACVAMEKLQALAASRDNRTHNADSLGSGLCTTASRSGTEKSNAPKGVRPSPSQPRHDVCPLIPPTQVEALQILPLEEETQCKSCSYDNISMTFPHICC